MFAPYDFKIKLLALEKLENRRICACNFFIYGLLSGREVASEILAIINIIDSSFSFRNYIGSFHQTSTVPTTGHSNYWITWWYCLIQFLRILTLLYQEIFLGKLSDLVFQTSPSNDFWIELLGFLWILLFLFFNLFVLFIFYQQIIVVLLSIYVIILYLYKFLNFYHYYYVFVFK